MNIYLISCVNMKEKIPCKAKNLYISPLFKKSLLYAKNNKADKIYILSAKYGLLDIDEVVEPYDLTLNQMSKNEIEIWNDKVLSQLKSKTNLSSDNFIILAGKNYYQGLLQYINNYHLPLQNLGIGERLSFLEHENYKFGLLC